jgi:predicted dehydrogenase
MSTNTLNVGVIGAGRMGITHHSIINTLPGVTVTAVTDPSSVVTSLLEKYAGVRAYGDHASMLEREPLDAVLVCTPPVHNHDILRQVHAKGLHAFVEKPFVLSSAAGHELARMFDDAGLVNQVGYMNRFNDVFSRARTLVGEGLIGKVLRFRSEMYSGTIVREQEKANWRATHANGGGAVYEMATHAIDLIHYLFGRPDRVGGTSLTPVFSRDVEDIVSSTFYYRNGPSGTIYVNWSDDSFRKPTNKLEVFGDRGKILADQHGMRIYLREADPARGFAAGWNDVYITDVFSSVPFYLRGIEYTAQLDHFVACIRAADRRPTRCSFADGAAAIAVTEDLFRDHAATVREMN